MTVTICRGANRPGVRECSACRCRLERTDKIVVTDEQTSWFRGEDVVNAYHLRCSPDFNDRVRQSKRDSGITPREDSV